MIMNIMLDVLNIISPSAAMSCSVSVLRARMDVNLRVMTCAPVHMPRTH